MKAKNRASGYILTTLLCALAFFSCRKEAAEQFPKNDLKAAANSLEGTKHTGIITVATEDGKSVLVFESRDKLVVVTIPESRSFPAGTMASAELVVSKAGVVVKDGLRNKVWLLANGDAQSQRKFDAVSTSWPNAQPRATILDLIEINTGTES